MFDVLSNHTTCARNEWIKVRGRKPRYLKTHMNPKAAPNSNAP